MPDISMCVNEECSIKSECYRYMAKPNVLWQVYSDFKPVDGKCGNFMEIYKGTRPIKVTIQEKEIQISFDNKEDVKQSLIEEAKTLSEVHPSKDCRFFAKNVLDYLKGNIK